MSSVAGFLAIVAGRTKQIFATVMSTGVADAGKIPAFGPDGRLHLSTMPLGIGAQTVQARASEAIAAGKFVNFFDDAGVFSFRLADNSNGRQADGFVNEAVASAATGVVYPLDGSNANMTGLVVGKRYWLGTAGGVTDTPLDETNQANANKVSQYLGIAKSPTELLTDDQGYVVL